MVVNNNVSSCSSYMVRAGAVVVGDMDKAGTYVGEPAKSCEKRNHI